MVLKQKIILALFLIVGTTFQVLPVIRSGLQYSYGYGFWGANGHDGIWHLSLINHIHDPLKINMPTFSGSTLSNYHPFFDIAISFLSRLSHLSSSFWLFQIFPVLSATTLLYLSFYLGRLLTQSFSGGLILLGLNVCANSFGWLVSFIKSGTLGGESLFWAMQSPSNQINPPYNLSLIFILVILIISIRQASSKSFSKTSALIIFVILSLLPITKAYSAIIGFGIFGVISLIFLVKHRNIVPSAVLTTSFISAIFLFRIYNPNPTNLLVYKPFWFINSMIESPDRIFIPYLANMRYALESSGNIGPRLITLWLTTFLLFILGNFGWRLLGIVTIIKQPNYLYLTLFSLIIIQTLIPTFFIQNGTSWNTIQFLYYAMFLANILLTAYLHSIKIKKLKLILIATIFLSNFLGLVGMLPNYLGTIPPAAIPKPEIEALKFLSSQSPGVVLTVPYDPYLKTSFQSTPIPLYAYETTSYVSAYSRQLTFVDDYMNLANSGYNYLSRLKSSQEFFTQKNIHQDRGFLINNNISYIYLTELQQKNINLDVSNLYLKKIFTNQKTTIYQVLR